jgi:benzoate-CoA ligase
MNTNIFYQIEKNATEDNYLNEIAVTQINSSNKIKRISYRALFSSSEKTSLALLELGIKKNDKVYISIKSSIEFISIFLGCLKNGVIPIPGNPELSNNQTKHILNNSTPTLIITDTKINCENLNFDHKYFSNRQWNIITNKVKSKSIKTCMSHISDIAFLIYSSGTTGLPKAIVHRHQSIINTVFLHKNILSLKIKDKIFTTSKLFFAYALGNNFFAPLLMGLNTIFNDAVVDPMNLSQIIKEHEPKVVFSVPTVYRRLLKNSTTELKILFNVKYFISAGERIPDKLYNKWLAAINSPLLNCYGTTETLAIVIATSPEKSKAGSTGKPITSIKTKLLKNNGEESNNKGVLHIKHHSFSQSYLDNKEKTLKTFNNGWINTGDIWSITNNYWYYQGREDDLIKVASKWVNPKELETEASKINNVIDSFCITAESKEGTHRLALFLYIKTSKDQNLIIRQVKDKISYLPKYKQPYWIKTITDVPQTATGKIRRNDLKNLIESNI